MPNTFIKINASPRKVLFCSKGISLTVPISFKCFSKLLEVVSKAPVMTGITVALTIQNFYISIPKSCDLSFSCSSRSRFWFPGIISMIKQFFFLLLIQTLSSRLALITLFVLILNSHRSLHWSFSSTASGICLLKVVRLSEKPVSFFWLLFHVFSYIEFLLGLRMYSKYGLHFQYFLCIVYKPSRQLHVQS